MKFIVVLFLVGALASNMRSTPILTKQQTTKTSFIEQETVPFVEETLSQQQNLEEPMPMYSNDGSSPDMGKQTDNAESVEAPMMADDVYDFSAQEQIINGVSLVQVQEIDALADIDTSMPLMDEDFKYDDQALQETPLNINVEEVPEVSIEQEAVVQETAEMVDSLSQEMDQQEILINEVQLIQVGGFYY